MQYFLSEGVACIDNAFCTRYCDFLLSSSSEMQLNIWMKLGEKFAVKREKIKTKKQFETGAGYKGREKEFLEEEGR
jgi:hypothetical protein